MSKAGVMETAFWLIYLPIAITLAIFRIGVVWLPSRTNNIISSGLPRSQSVKSMLFIVWDTRTELKFAVVLKMKLFVPLLQKVAIVAAAATT